MVIGESITYLVLLSFIHLHCKASPLFMFSFTVQYCLTVIFYHVLHYLVIMHIILHCFYHFPLFQIFESLPCLVDMLACKRCFIKH